LRVAGHPAKIRAVTEKRTALVLSGGGSRGAYEAGIILFIRERLSRRRGGHVPLDIITGTSVGAINASFLAATCEDPSTQAQRLVQAWRSLRLEELLSLGALDMIKAVRQLVRSDPPPPLPGTFRYGGLLDTSGLEKFVIEIIPWRNIHRNLRRGHLHSLSVSATHVGTGHTVVFVHSRDPVPLSWSQNPFVRHRAAHIGPRHVLASAAIPMLFPAVKIHGEYFTDGGLRQNTPMSPAIRLGADKILLVSLRHMTTPSEEAARLEQREAAYPRPLFLMGKALNALLLDHTEYDLERMERLNAILEAGQEAFGPQFVDVLNSKLIELRGAPIRHIRAMHIRPSVDIGVLASDFVARGKATIQGRMARTLLERLAERESSHENDLLSYFLFDGNYAEDLIELGYQDAAAKEDELLAFFADDPT
jgi:NTE family protein